MSEQYEVEEILEKKLFGNIAKYKIKWVGYEYDECTWEPEKNLSQCKEMVKKFNEGGLKETASSKITSDRNLQKNKQTKGFVNENLKKKKMDQQTEGMDEEQESNHETAQNRQNTSRASEQIRKSIRLIKNSNKNGNALNEENQEVEDMLFTEEEQVQKLPIKKDGKEGKYKVLGIFRDPSDQIFFRIKDGDNVETFTRQEMIQKDVLSIVDFYESHIKFIKPNSKK